MAKESKASEQQDQLINLQAQQLAAQIANWAAQLEFQKQRFSLLELPEWQQRSQLDVDKFAWEKAQSTWENAFKEASLTGTYQGKPTLEWLTQQAQLTGVFNGEETIQGKLTNAQISQMNQQMKLANDQFLATTTGYVNGQPTFDREKWQASQAVLGWQFLSTLSGPQNAFKQARAIANMPGGLSQMMDAWAGTNMVPGTSSVGSGGQASLADMRLGANGISGTTPVPSYQYGYTPPSPAASPIPPTQPGGPSPYPGEAPIGTPGVPSPTAPGVGTPGVPSHVQEPVPFQPGQSTPYPEGYGSVRPWATEPMPVQPGAPSYYYEGAPPASTPAPYGAPEPVPAGSYAQPSGHGSDAYSDAGSWQVSSAQEQVMAATPQVASGQPVLSSPVPTGPIVNNIPQQMMGWAQNNNGPGEWTYLTGGASRTTPETAYSYPVTDADFRMPPSNNPAYTGGAPMSTVPYTYSGPGVQAPADAWNYGIGPGGGIQVYPPGTVSPADTPDVSLTSAVSPAMAASLHAGNYQYGGVPLAGSGTTTTQSQLGAVPLPNQINARNYSNLYGYQKDLGWANYEDIGWDQGLAKEAFQRSLPRYGGPATGRVAF